MNIHLYPYIVLGGTFDLLHIGHKAFLLKAFNIGRFVTIGVTTDKFNKERNKESFQNQSIRLKVLKKFLKQNDYLERCRIVLINNIFGTTLKDPKLEAIIITDETKKGALLINKERVGKGMNKLKIITFPHIKDKKGRIISASRIRIGEINPLGQSYKDMLLKIAGKRLADPVRFKLKKPLGKILVGLPHTPYPHPLISVGDVTTPNLLENNIQPSLAIIDAKVARKGIVSKIEYSTKIKNPPGQISRALVLAISQYIKKLRTADYELRTILIDGEEDLAAIPAILLSPLGAGVYYGQPDKGLVEVKVDLKIKDQLIKLLGF